MHFSFVPCSLVNSGRFFSRRRTDWSICARLLFNLVRAFSESFVVKSNFASGEDSDFTAESRQFLVAFFALQLTGLFTLTIVLLTVALSPNVAKRHICWLNFIFTWMVSGLSYRCVDQSNATLASSLYRPCHSLLVGRPINWEPPYGLCLTQAVLIYTVPTL